MDKRHINEIDARIMLCLDAESKLDYVDNLLKNQKISKLESHIIKQNILKDKSEETVREEINNYVEKAIELKNKLIKENKISKIKNLSVAVFTVLLLFGLFSFIKNPAITGLSIVSIKNSLVQTNLLNISFFILDVLLLGLFICLIFSIKKGGKS